MARTGELDERLTAAYRDAAERLRMLGVEAAARTQAAMRSTPGWQAAAKAAAAQSMLEATRSECDGLVTELVEAHLDSGERDAEQAAQMVREHFLNDLTAPGLPFFPDSGAEAATLTVVALRHAADFESFRDRLAGQVAERFRTIQTARERRSLPARVAPPRWRRLGESRFVVAFLVVTAVLSLAGVSWMDVIGWVLAFL